MNREKLLKWIRDCDVDSRAIIFNFTDKDKNDLIDLFDSVVQQERAKAEKEILDKWEELKKLHKCNENSYYWGDIGQDFDKFLKGDFRER